MNDKIEVTFLSKVNEPIDAGFRILDTLDSNERFVQVAKNMLTGINKTYQKIIEDSTQNESGKLFTDRNYIPEILWLRSSSAGIGMKVSQSNGILPEELTREMTKFFHHFDKFYQTWVTNG